MNTSHTETVYNNVIKGVSEELKKSKILSDDAIDHLEKCWKEKLKKSGVCNQERKEASIIQPENRAFNIQKQAPIQPQRHDNNSNDMVKQNISILDNSIKDGGNGSTIQTKTLPVSNIQTSKLSQKEEVQSKLKYEEPQKMESVISEEENEGDEKYFKTQNNQEERNLKNEEGVPSDAIGKTKSGLQIQFTTNIIETKIEEEQGNDIPNIKNETRIKNEYFEGDNIKKENLNENKIKLEKEFLSDDDEDDDESEEEEDDDAHFNKDGGVNKSKVKSKKEKKNLLGKPNEQVEDHEEIKKKLKISMENEKARIVPLPQEELHLMEKFSNSEISDDDDDKDIEAKNQIYGYYEKVTRSGTRWKAVFKDLIFCIDEKEYIFTTLAGEFNWEKEK